MGSMASNRSPDFEAWMPMHSAFQWSTPLKIQTVPSFTVWAMVASVPHISSGLSTQRGDKTVEARPHAQFVDDYGSTDYKWLIDDIGTSALLLTNASMDFP
jgi:hypothetical protein